MVRSVDGLLVASATKQGETICATHLEGQDALLRQLVPHKPRAVWHFHPPGSGSGRTLTDGQFMPMAFCEARRQGGHRHSHCHRRLRGARLSAAGRQPTPRAAGSALQAFFAGRGPTGGLRAPPRIPRPWACGAWIQPTVWRRGPVNPGHTPRTHRGPLPACVASRSPTPHCVHTAVRECRRVPWTAVASRRPGGAIVRSVSVPRPSCAPHRYGNGLAVPPASSSAPRMAFCAEPPSWSAKVAIVPDAPVRPRQPQVLTSPIDSSSLKATFAAPATIRDAFLGCGRVNWRRLQLERLAGPTGLVSTVTANRPRASSVALASGRRNIAVSPLRGTPAPRAHAPSSDSQRTVRRRTLRISGASPRRWWRPHCSEFRRRSWPLRTAWAPSSRPPQSRKTDSPGRPGKLDARRSRRKAPAIGG